MTLRCRCSLRCSTPPIEISSELYNTPGTEKQILFGGTWCGLMTTFKHNTAITKKKWLREVPQLACDYLLPWPYTLTCPKISSLTVNDKSSVPVMSFSVSHVMLWWNRESIASTSLRSHGLKEQRSQRHSELDKNTKQNKSKDGDVRWQVKNEVNERNIPQSMKVMCSRTFKNMKKTM